ncbi:ABC transporter ATP-binding protein [Dermatobacter hominis]|uniref:ABC transporter ATP-binding protein n=1 Tax=Dermatobacter hominis TaxID=2884263 RepID=UPI001D11C4B4|nr:ABC transporter ATP-binding protein [Dermatobacter hominis]UDY36541.1 ABC transporter ATP-binding protein [Dermatobacter hominis]
MNQKKSRRAERHEPPALAVHGLSKYYGDVAALEEMDLEVPAGQSVVLVGHNGSGKSTLLSMIAGVLEPSEGDVLVHGQPNGTLHARAELSWLPDSPVLYDDLSLWEHVEYINRMHGGSGDDPFLDELLERLGVEDRKDHLPSQFSRGLRQKSAIAVALCRPFSVLLVDEPFVGLDAAGRLALLELIDEARDNDATVLVATHDPDVIDRFERGLMLENGELVHDGPASDLHGMLGADDRHSG